MSDYEILDTFQLHATDETFTEVQAVRDPDTDRYETRIVQYGKVERRDGSPPTLPVDDGFRGKLLTGFVKMAEVAQKKRTEAAHQRFVESGELGPPDPEELEELLGDELGDGYEL